jgi:3-oxoadipate enol-lactonase
MICKTRDGLDLYYEVFGNTSANKTIIFLNGLTQTTLAWALMTPYFKQDYRILLLDLIFQGKSEKARHWRDFDQHAEDVKCVLDSEKITKINMVGISYGSLVAQHFAVRFPDRLEKLVLISTFAHKTPYYEAIELSWWRALEAGGYNLMLDIMLPTVLSENYFSNPLIPIESMKEARRDLQHTPEAILNLMRATKERKDFRKDLNKIKVPTLIIQGEKDMLFPVHMAEEVQKNIPSSNLHIVKHAGHTLNLEHFGEVSQQILEFLR